MDHQVVGWKQRFLNYAKSMHYLEDTLQISDPESDFN